MDRWRKAISTQQTRGGPAHSLPKVTLTEKSNTCSLIMIFHQQFLAWEGIAHLLPTRQRDPLSYTVLLHQRHLLGSDCSQPEDGHSSCHPHPPHPPPAIPTLSALAAVRELWPPKRKKKKNGKGRNRSFKYFRVRVPCIRSSSAEPESCCGQKRLWMKQGPVSQPRPQCHDRMCTRTPQWSSPSPPCPPTDTQDLVAQTLAHAKSFPRQRWGQAHVMRLICRPRAHRTKAQVYK